MVFFKCIHYIENHNEKAFCSDIKFISCCFFESVHVCAWLLNWPCIFFNSTCGGYWLQKKRNNESISILCLLILSKLKIYKISWECRSIQQCVRLLICQSDSLSATMLINSRSSIHDILHKSFTVISFWNSIWKFFSNSGTLLPHTGYYTACYVICVQDDQCCREHAWSQLNLSFH